MVTDMAISSGEDVFLFAGILVMDRELTTKWVGPGILEVLCCLSGFL